MFTVLIIDNEALVTERLSMMISSHPPLEITGIANTLSEGLELCRTQKPGIVITEIRLPDALGKKIVDAVREAAPDAKLVVFTNIPDDFYRDIYVCFGAEYCVDKNDPLELQETIEELLTTA